MTNLDNLSHTAIIEHMESKNKEILEYVEKQHNTQLALLQNIDTKMANILVVIGLLLTVTTFLSQIFYATKENFWSSILLIPFFIATYAILKALFICIKLLRLTDYNIPSLEAKTQTSLMELQKMKEADENKIIYDLTQNYLAAFNKNQLIMEDRKKYYPSMLAYLKNGIFLLLISAIGVLTIYYNIPHPNVKNKVKEVIKMTENRNSKKSSDNTDSHAKKEPTQAPIQPSAQGDPTIITAGEKGRDVKIVESKPDSIILEKGAEENKGKKK